MDVSKNSELTVLICFNNQLTSLNIKNSALTVLYCQNNQLSNLDISPNGTLYSLVCSSNILTGLDLSKNIALESLFCENNLLTSLDLSVHNNLTVISCSFNPIIDLAVSNDAMFSNIYCTNCQLDKKALNALFEMLPSGCFEYRSETILQKFNATIYISKNRGTKSCNPKIATQKEWIVDKR